MTKQCARCGEAERNLTGQCIPCRKAAVAGRGMTREAVRALMEEKKDLIAEMRRPVAHGRPPRD